MAADDKNAIEDYAFAKKELKEYHKSYLTNLTINYIFDNLIVKTNF